jgi:hypothetical protein
MRATRLNLSRHVILRCGWSLEKQVSSAPKDRCAAEAFLGRCPCLLVSLPTRALRVRRFNPPSRLVSEGGTHDEERTDDGENQKHPATRSCYAPPPARPYAEAARRAGRRCPHHGPAAGVSEQGSLPTDLAEACRRVRGRARGPGRRRAKVSTASACLSRVSGRTDPETSCVPPTDPAGFIYPSYRAADSVPRRDDCSLEPPHRGLARVSTAVGGSLFTLSFEDTTSKHRRPPTTRRGGGIRGKVMGCGERSLAECQVCARAHLYERAQNLRLHTPDLGRAHRGNTRRAHRMGETEDGGRR